MGYKDEPWSMQALEKRIYGVRDFYKHVLKGVEDDNPGEAQSVKDALAMLRLIVGYKPTHVPKVSYSCNHVTSGVGRSRVSTARADRARVRRARVSRARVSRARVSRARVRRARVSRA